MFSFLFAAPSVFQDALKQNISLDFFSGCCFVFHPQDATRLIYILIYTLHMFSDVVPFVETFVSLFFLHSLNALIKFFFLPFRIHSENARRDPSRL